MAKIVHFLYLKKLYLDQTIHLNNNCNLMIVTLRGLVIILFNNCNVLNFSLVRDAFILLLSSSYKKKNILIRNVKCNRPFS